MTQHRQHRQPRYALYAAIAVGLVLLLALFGYGVLKVVQRLRARSTLTVVQVKTTPTAAPAEPLSVVRLEPDEDAGPPVLQLIDFPEEPAAYPVGWPEEHRLPANLQPAAVEVGTLDDRLTLSGKFRSDATPGEVAAQIQAHLGALGWQITEMVIEGEQEVLIVTEEIQAWGNGLFVITADPNGGSRMMVTLVVD